MSSGTLLIWFKVVSQGLAQGLAQQSLLSDPPHSALLPGWLERLRARGVQGLELRSETPTMSLLPPPGPEVAGHAPLLLNSEMSTPHLGFPPCHSVLGRLQSRFPNTVHACGV